MTWVLVHLYVYWKKKPEQKNKTGMQRNNFIKTQVLIVATEQN